MVDAAWVDHGCRIVKALEAPDAPTQMLTVMLGSVWLHADLRVARVQVGLAYLLRYRLHAILADLAHPAHFRTLVHRTRRRGLLLRLSLLGRWHYDILGLRLVHHIGDILLNILWQIVIQPLEAVIGSDQV